MFQAHMQRLALRAGQRVFVRILHVTRTPRKHVYDLKDAVKRVKRTPTEPARPRTRLSGWADASHSQSYETAWRAVSGNPENLWRRVRSFMMLQRHYKGPGIDFHMSHAEVAGHMSFALLAISYSCTDIFHLRLFAIASIGSMMVFNFWHPVGVTLWLPFRWNTLFLGLNVAWVSYLHSRYNIAWIDSAVNMRDVHNEAFPSLNKMDYVALMRKACYAEYERGAMLTKTGSASEKVHYVIDGDCDVLKGGDILYKVREKQFVGTGGLHTGLYRDRGVMETKVTSGKLKCLEWRKSDLIDLVEKNTRILAAFDAALSIDELKKTYSAWENAKTHHRRIEMDADNDLQMYHTLVKGVVGDSNAVSLSDKQALRRYRGVYGVTDDEHAEALQRVGWTLRQFEMGSKQARGATAPEVVESARRLSAGDAQGAQDCPGPAGLAAA